MRANFDKPHRCPVCHGIVTERRFRLWRVYRCKRDRVLWFGVESKLSLLAWRVFSGR